MRLFGDSSAWLPFFDRRERQNEIVREAVSMFSRQSLTIYVTDYVIDETLTLILARVGHSTAVTCGHWLLRSPFVKIVRVDADTWQRAWDMFRRYDDKVFSFT